MAGGGSTSPSSPRSGERVSGSIPPPERGSPLPGLARDAAAHLRRGLARVAARLRALSGPSPARRVEPWLVPVFAIVVLCVAAAVAIAFDEPTVRAARTLPLELIHLFAWVTVLGEAGLWLWPSALIAAILAVLAGREESARAAISLETAAARVFFLFAAIGAPSLVVTLIKRLVGRARPRHLDTLGPFEFRPVALDASFAGFPSGHATTAFAVAMALGFFAPRWRIALFAGAALVAGSRIMVGAHYPSDVIAGAALGLAGAWFVRRWFARAGIVFAVDETGETRLRGSRVSRLAPRMAMRAIRSAPGKLSQG
jgi:undecaprenyl-diphosphatase